MTRPHDPDDGVTWKQVLGGALVSVLFSTMVIGVIYPIIMLSHRPRVAKRPAPHRVVRTLPSTTTTTDPYANLRASLNDYCGAKGLGHASIVVRNGAPIGGCSGR